MTEVNSLFDSLAKTAERLNEKSDSINETLEAFEKKLNELNLGLEVWLSRNPLEVTDSEGDSQHSKYHKAILGYCKLGGEWKLTVKRLRVEAWVEEENDYQQEFDPTYRGLLDASRELRIAALDLLPTLLEDLEDKALDSIKYIAKAKKTLEK